MRRARLPESTVRGERRQKPLVKVKREWVIGVLLLLVLLVAVCGLWIVGLMKAKPSAEVASAVGSEPLGMPARWLGPVPPEVADAFVAAKTHQDRLKLVRNPEQVSAEMEAFFRDGPGATEKVAGIRPVMTAGASGGMLFEEFNVDLEGGGERLLSVSIDPQGAKVDFECYARHGSDSWDGLLSGKVEAADEVRVILRAGGYHLHEFEDETKWRHFSATTPDLPDGFDLYIERSSPAARELAEVAGTMFRATLSIRSVNGSSKHRQFEITRVKALSWAEPQ